MNCIYKIFFMLWLHYIYFFIIDNLMLIARVVYNDVMVHHFLLRSSC